MARLDFDANDPSIDTRDPFEVLPDGTEVIVELRKSEVKETKDGNGSYLACEFVSIDEEHPNRHFFDNITLDNPNEKAVTIGKAQLARLCLAAGKPQVADSEELHGVPVCAVLGVEPAKNGYPAKNRIKNFKPPEEKGQKAAKKSSAPAHAASTAPASDKSATRTAPWKQKAG